MNKRKGIILVFFTALISGFSIFINSFGVKGFDSSIFTFSKNVIVSLFLFSIIVAFGKLTELKKITKKQWFKLSSIGLIGGSIPFLLFFKGLQMTTGTTSAFIHKTLFIYVAVFALIFLREKLNKSIVIGAAFLIVGNYMLLKPNFMFDIGHLLIFGATIFWAVEQVISKHALKELSGNNVAFGRMFFGSFFILLFLFFTQKTSLIFSMHADQYFWILLTSIFLLMYVVTYYNGLKEIKVTTAASILALGSPITLLLSFVFKGVLLTQDQVIGMFLIVVGIITVIWFIETEQKLLSTNKNLKYHEWN